MNLGMVPDAAAQFGNGNCELTIIVNDSSETTDDQSTELGPLTVRPTGRIKSSSSKNNIRRSVVHYDLRSNEGLVGRLDGEGGWKIPRAK